MKPRIENLEQALDWAKRANEVCSTKVRVDLQDEFARSDVKIMEDIIRQAIGKDGRRLLLFGVYKVMGDHWLEQYLRIWSVQMANRHLEKEAEILDKRHDDLFNKEKALKIREDAFKDLRKPIYKKFRTMKDEIDKLEKKAEREKAFCHHQGEVISELRTTVRDLEFELTKLKEVRLFIRMLNDVIKLENM